MAPCRLPLPERPAIRERMRHPLARSCLALLASAAVAGCKLVDQRSFVAHADAPPVVRVPPGRPAPPATPPLLAIRFPASEDQWGGPLRVVVELARSRKPDVVFTVQGVVPSRGTPAEQAALLSRSTAEIRAVGAAIVADGVDPLQVQFTAATDASAPGEEVRIFVH